MMSRSHGMPETALSSFVDPISPIKLNIALYRIFLIHIKGTYIGVVYNGQKRRFR